MSSNFERVSSKNGWVRRARSLAGVAAASVLVATSLAACSTAGETVVADENTGNRVIRVAMPFISTMNSAILYGEGAGIFADHDIEIQFTTVDGARGLAATLSGSVDMAITSAVNPLAALEQGQEFFIVAAIGNGFPESVIVTDDAWEESGLEEDSPWEEKVDFLRGKPWGVSSPEGSSSYMARYLFQLAGFPQEDFNMQSLGSSSATLAAMQADQVVAGSMGSPNPQVAEAEGYAHMFLSIAGGEVPGVSNLTTSVVAVPPSFYAANVDLIEDFRVALAEAQALVYSDSETVDEWMYENYFDGSPKEAVLRGVQEQRDGGAIAKQPEVALESAQAMVDFMEATGQVVPENWQRIFIDLQ